MRKFAPTLIAVTLGVVAWPISTKANEAKPATPIGNPGTWILDSDYPADARRDNLGGTTHFDLKIGKDGQVSDCKIIQSSGAAVLDEATCRLISSRALFSPAEDKFGKKIIGSFSNRVNWQVPANIPQVRQLPSVQTFSVETSYLVNEMGTQTDCEVVKYDAGDTGIPLEEFRIAFQNACEGRSDGIYRDPNGNAIRVRVNQIQSTRVDPLP